MYYLGLKDSSCHVHSNHTISFLFQLHLMLHLCVQRVAKKIWQKNWKLNMPLLYLAKIFWPLIGHMDGALNVVKTKN